MVGRCGFDPLPRREPLYRRLAEAIRFPFPWWPPGDSISDRMVSKTIASTSWARGPYWRNAEGMIPKPSGSSRLAGGCQTLWLHVPKLADGGGVEPRTLRLPLVFETSLRPYTRHHPKTTPVSVRQYRNQLPDELGRVRSGFMA